ncbi:MAG: hypothetical protein L7U83_02870, partial [Akkermansiaceae bacterium]|nr:hypothetical protein [Akkermansiaceae bacterium]
YENGSPIFSDLIKNLSPPCIPPKFVLHGLSSKSKFLAVTFPQHEGQVVGGFAKNLNVQLKTK